MYYSNETIENGKKFYEYLVKNGKIKEFKKMCNEYDKTGDEVEKLEDKASKSNYKGLFPTEYTKIDDLRKTMEVIFEKMKEMYREYKGDKIDIYCDYDYIVYVAENIDNIDI